MTVYLIVLFFNLFLLAAYTFHKKTRLVNIIFIVAFLLPLVFISAFKGLSVGNDTIMYEFVYTDSKADPLFPLGEKWGMEFGYIFLNRLLSKTGMSFNFFLLICYLIIYFGIGLFVYKKSDDKLIALFLIVYLGFLGFSMSGIRQSLAIGIGLIGFAFLKRTKPISFLWPILSVGVAFCFHNSSIVMLPIILFPLVRCKKRTVYILTPYFVLLCFLAPNIFISFYTFFFQNIFGYTPAVDDTFFSLIIYSLLLIFGICSMSLSFTSFFEKIKFINKETKITRAIKEENSNSSISLMATPTIVECKYLLPLFYITFILSLGRCSSVFSRLIYAIIPFCAVCLLAITRNYKSKNIRSIIRLGLVVFAAVYFVGAVLIKNPINIVPYQFCF